MAERGTQGRIGRKICLHGIKRRVLRIGGGGEARQQAGIGVIITGDGGGMAHAVRGARGCVAGFGLIGFADSARAIATRWAEMRRLARWIWRMCHWCDFSALAANPAR